jgi:gamma-glutamylcyclotransferase (GGCT)/AIG2-like uncharacterized protein YtfP
MNEPLLFFSYGMLTHNDVMSEGAIRLGPAALPGFEWEMLCYANVYDKPGNMVLGVLWEIDRDILDDLDQREGYPTFYDREYVDILHGGIAKQAWVYFMTDSYREILRRTTPSESYLNTVIEGFATDGITMPNLNAADIGFDLD